jgi:predicted ATPase
MHSRTVELDFSRIHVSGRQEELRKLQSALERVTSNASLKEGEAARAGIQVVLIEGASGTGKTALVEAFREAVVDQNRTFYLGKFEENWAVAEPFSAIVECVYSMLDSLFQRFPDWMEAIDDETTAQIRTLAVILPSRFRDLLMKKSRGTDNDIYNQKGHGEDVPTDSQNCLDFKSQWGFKRLRLALRALIRSACNIIPVVLVLEDLHWADVESLKLLRTLLTDKKGKHLLFIGTLRSNYTGPATDAIAELKSHLVVASNDDPKRDEEQLQTIHVGDLRLQDVTEILSSLLRRDPNDAQPLAELIHRKTSGNAFFVLQFLHLLYERCLVDYSLSNYQWEWDLDRIAAETHVADNVLDILSEKILRLPAELQLALTQAAFLGPSRFDAEILLHTLSTQERKQIVEKANDAYKQHDDIQYLVAIEETLLVAVNEGLLEKLRSPRIYKFAHDRIKESAYALVPKGDAQKSRHLHTGRHLRRFIDEKGTTGLDTRVGDRRLFLLAARHMNLGSDLLETGDEKVELARLNYQAAELAFEMSSFFPAGEYLQAGLSLLDKGSRWDRHYELTLQLATALTHVRFCCGETDSISALVDEIFEYGKSLKDKLGAYRSTILSLFQDGKTERAIAMNLYVLDKLGVHMPRRFLKLNILKRVLRSRRKLRHYSDEDLLSFPTSKDENLRHASLFASLLGALSVATGNTEYQLLALIQATSVTLQGATNDWTVVSLAACGYLHSMFGEYDTAYRYGKLALQMVGESNTHSRQDARGTIMTYFSVWHWKHPYHDCLAAFLRAYKMALDNGAIEDLYFAITSYSIIYYICGLQLDPIQKDMKRFAEVLEDYGQTYFLALYQPQKQLILNLMGQSDDPTTLTGEGMNQEEFFQMCTETRNQRALQHFHLIRMFLAYFFDDLQLADSMASELSPPIKDGPSPWLAPRFLFEGLIAFGLAKSTYRSRRRYRRHGLGFVRKLEKFVDQGNVNCQHMVLLLLAELASIDNGASKQVQAFYDKAIRAAGRTGFTHHQAIGNEQAGLYFLNKQKDRAWAATYLTRAWELFDHWGAKAKTQLMEKKYEGLLVISTQIRFPSELGSARARFDEKQMASGSRKGIEFSM